MVMQLVVIEDMHIPAFIIPMTLRREYHRMKLDCFLDLIKLHPKQKEWFQKKEITHG